MKRFFISILFLLSLLNISFGVGEASAIFLLIAPGSGAQGSGEAQVAKVDDAYASWYNPAGLAYLERTEIVGMHVNWLPNLADDLYYDFIGYSKYYPQFNATFGGHIIYLNLGSQIQTDDTGIELGEFRSNMWALNLSYGSKISSKSSFGLNFKIHHQGLAPDGAGIEEGSGKSTDFAFDVGYLKKFNKTNFGICISNIGPKVSFIDEDQADPQPTNMKFGFYHNLYNDGFNKINLLFDANKLLVATYPSMDWDDNGVIDSSEKHHTDPWFKGIFTSWLDDWYFGGNIDEDDNGVIGGYNCSFNSDGYLEEDCISTESSSYGDDDWGVYNSSGELEVGSDEDRKFSNEFKEMIYNFGVEYWYTDYFVLRGGYIYDYEGNIKNPTFGAGIRFLDYGFDFAYTAGEQGHPRANTMFFSLSVKL
tara:strand:+ start:480 stop:1742 length:1263 start_codon:yes stop_codon:yes gene_type:complete